MKKPAICASIIGDSIEDFVASVRQTKDADIIEIRADGLNSPTPDKVKELIERVKLETSLPIILTNRMKKEGGLFSGSEGKRIAVIKECMDVVEAIDIELCMAGAARKEIADDARAEKIISFHDFGKTPSEDFMLEKIEEEFYAGADIAKIAVRARSREDVITLLRVTQKASSLGKVCTISMGRLGMISRIAGPFFGSAITYGYVTEPTAPGQLSVSELKTALEIIGVIK